MSERYDIIVVGAGSAGCALAARLSENPERSVLLVEAGPRLMGADSYPPEIRYASSFGAAVPGHPNNWAHPANLIEGVHYPIPRGKIVGGSSAINGAVFTRGLAEDFDGWAAAGNPAWAFAEVLPYFRKLERDADLAGADHGEEGPVPVARTPRARWAPVSSAFVTACEAAGFAVDADMNGAASIGVGALPLNTVGGERRNMAFNYLDPIAARPNLRVLPDTLVHKVNIADGRATGIIVERGGELSQIDAGEVVLSAGAIKSPHLLMLSGIGPAEVLAPLGITLVHELPHVGRNLTDHTTLHFPLRIPRRVLRHLDPVTTPFSEVAMHYTTPGSEVHSDMMLMQNVFPFNAAMIRDASLGQRVRMLGAALRQMSWGKFVDQIITQWDLAMTIILMQGASRGEVRMTSADPAVSPTLDYHYLEDESDYWRLREGFRLAARLVGSAPFRRLGVTSNGPSAETLASDDLLDGWIRSRVSTSMHSASTCRMGVSAADSVVDQHCRVHGVANLRVVDMSIMPIVVRRCPHASAVMIGERAAAFF